MTTIELMIWKKLENKWNWSNPDISGSNLLLKGMVRAYLGCNRTVITVSFSKRMEDFILSKCPIVQLTKFYSVKCEIRCPSEWWVVSPTLHPAVRMHSLHLGCVFWRPMWSQAPLSCNENVIIQTFRLYVRNQLSCWTSFSWQVPWAPLLHLPRASSKWKVDRSPL